MAKNHIVERWQSKRVKRRLEDRRVVLLAGARQCGKTTLARTLRSDETEYRTLDDLTLRESAADDPNNFVRHDAKTLIIDEIQRAPELLPAIKLVVDQNRQPGQFLLTGSANLSAIPQAKESLAGRVAKIRLRPFTQGELQGVQPSFLQRAFDGRFTNEIAQISRDKLVTAAFRGGYPEAIELDEQGRRSWHRDYLAALLERDLADLARIHRLDAMRKLVEIVAAWSSKLMNVTEIGSGLSIKRPTVEAYLAALEALYLIDRVPAWTKTDYERVGKHDKLFLADSGLMTTILNWRPVQVEHDPDRVGKLIETFAYNELAAQCDLHEDYRLYHYRDRSQREIDFLVERESDGSIIGIEIKASSTVKSQAFDHLRWFKANLCGDRPFNGIVLYSGPQIASFGDGMLAVPMSAMWSA